MFKRIVEIWLSKFFALSLTCVFLFRFVLSFISCCSIFKDHRLLAACSCDLFIISHFLAFVKGFCKSFLSFFLKFFCFAVPWLRLAATFILYHIFKRLSRGFEKVFWIFFQSRLARCRSWRDLYIISYFIAFVKRFCKSFSKVFCRPYDLLSRSSLVDSSYIIAHSFRFVNSFFNFSFTLCI